RTYRDDREKTCKRDPGGIPDEQHLDRGPCLHEQGTVNDSIDKGLDRRAERRKEQGVVERSGIDLPCGGEHDQDRDLAYGRKVVDALESRERLLDDAELRGVDRIAVTLRAQNSDFTHGGAPPARPRRRTASNGFCPPVLARPRHCRAVAASCS